MLRLEAVLISPGQQLETLYAEWRVPTPARAKNWSWSNSLLSHASKPRGSTAVAAAPSLPLPALTLGSPSCVESDGLEAAGLAHWATAETQANAAPPAGKVHNAADEPCP